VQLEQLTPQTVIRGILPDAAVTVVQVQWHGDNAITLAYRTPTGGIAEEILYRHDEARLSIVDVGRPWSFDGDGALFRLVSEAQRIRLAHLFDPLLAVHTSDVDPLPHQISAVYEVMLPRQPLRFLLADDPGAGKTIMAGLLIKELIARGDLVRCLIVCPGSLAEQWQEELFRRFNLGFEILTSDGMEAARTGNWFIEHNLVIARLDKLSRNDDLQQKLQAPDCRWDLVVCDEAHKMSATTFGGETKYTKRYQLGRLLAGLTRHFLLMSATPHNGKEDDFQLFMALLDGDRFEGRHRDGVHTADVSDLMRRMVKESLVKFDGTPLFPERIAHTVPYKLSQPEAELYKSVTDYVREQFNRAEALENNKRAGTVGFALTILQRRLASSPEAIYQSIHRRRERLEGNLRELELLHRAGQGATVVGADGRSFDAEDLDDLDEATDLELEEAEAEVLDQATAAQTLAELKTEIATLLHLETEAQAVRRSATDTKWVQLSGLLGAIFATVPAESLSEGKPPYGSGPIPPPKPSPHQKLVIFTEHRDTLNYLKDRITRFLGRPESVLVIHGGVGREERLKIQEAFKFDPDVKVLLATDAAGEGINLQRAHLMVNYDLPWNPNRLEQRFGRIHRIGQKEPCHLWNLVAEETREGDVYRKLLDKLEMARQALGGQVFDVLGKLQFEGMSLKDLLIKAIRYNELPETKQFLSKVFQQLDRSKFQALIEDRALVPDTMDTSRIQTIRGDMERAEARKLQPHYIAEFFHEAFKRLGGTLRQREPKRYEIKHVPPPIRQRDRIIGSGEPVLPRYERVVFERSLVAPQGQPLAAFLCPGHPLLDSVLDLTLEGNRDLLKRGTVLVDDRDYGMIPKTVFYLEHTIQDARSTASGERRVISKRVLYVEVESTGTTRHVHNAPYLDCRPLHDSEPAIAAILQRPECQWVTRSLEASVQQHAIAKVVPEHLREVREPRLKLIAKTESEVKARLTKEINHWDHRAEQLRAQEAAGKATRLSSNEARKRADGLQARLQKRLEELKLEAQIAPLPPVVLGGYIVVPIGLLRAMQPAAAATSTLPVDTQASAARARLAVMQAERDLGFDPVDREFEKLGYDIESRTPQGRLRFLEVKGRVADADTITVTKNEVLCSLNSPETFILALVEFHANGSSRVRYLRQPFVGMGVTTDFNGASVDFPLRELLARATEPA
jgi:superfamily II DNA or RNA helicase